MTEITDQVFTLREGEWLAFCNGKMIAATFNSKGAALAGVEVQKRRNQRKVDHAQS